MTERGNELRVGITLTIAGLVLIFGILWLGGLKFGDDTYQFSIIFPEVAGLVVGDRVTVAGISSGEVTALELSEGRVVARVSIDSSVRIPIDSRLSVSTYGLIGAKVVELQKRSSPSVGMLRKGCPAGSVSPVSVPWSVRLRSSRRLASRQSF